jgi:hypothetical protein
MGRVSPALAPYESRLDEIIRECSCLTLRMVSCGMTTSTSSLPASSNILASDKVLSCKARRAAAKTKVQLALADSHVRKAGASKNRLAKILLRRANTIRVIAAETAHILRMK